MIDKLPDIPLNKFTKVKKDNKKIKINKNTPPPKRHRILNAQRNIKMVFITLAVSL